MGLTWLLIRWIIINCVTINFKAYASEKPPERPQPLEEPRNFNEFIGKCLQRSVLNYITKPLTKHGDNYASVFQALEVNSSKNDDSNENATQHLVFKAMLPGAISTKRSKQFWKEAHFYSNIIPALERFEEAANVPETERIDAFARYFCSRLSLNPGAADADTDALILFENLKAINFVIRSVSSRLNKEEILAVLKRLAKIHALVIAMRRMQPNCFCSQIDPYLQNIDDTFIKKRMKRVKKFIAKVPTNFTHIPPELHKAIKKAMNVGKKFYKSTARLPDTPYTTLYHADLWTKNIMTRKGCEANSSIQVRVLDFQAYYYGSFAFDLVQFIFFNGRVDDLRTYFKLFIDYYLVEFVKTLRLFKCPLDDYTDEKMWREIKDKAKIMLLNLYSYLAKEKTTLLRNSTIPVRSGPVSEDFFFDYPTPEALLKRWKCITELYIENGFI